jgi:hypothetical protein
MVDYFTASEAVMFLIGFFTSSLMWVAFCIMCFRKNHEEALKLADEQYMKGFRRGKKAATLTPDAPSDSDI